MPSKFYADGHNLLEYGKWFDNEIHDNSTINHLRAEIVEEVEIYLHFRSLLDIKLIQVNFLIEDKVSFIRHSRYHGIID